MPAPFASCRAAVTVAKLPPCRVLAAVSVLGLLAGCAEGGLAGNLRSAGVGGTPDEFMVLPTRPLEMPSDFSALPTPAPGTPNRVDLQPRADAIAGLTGRPGVAGNADGTVLVAAAGPREANVRSQLAAEDVVWQQTHHGLLLERMIAKDKASVTYAQMILSAPLEFFRLRANGTGVPPAPPGVLDE